MNLRLTTLLTVLLLIFSPFLTPARGEDFNEAFKDAVDKAMENVSNEMSRPGYWDDYFEKMANVAVTIPTAKEIPAKWTVLGSNEYVKDMRFISRDRLLISYQSSNPILLDTTNGKVLWRFRPDGWLTSGADVVMAFKDLILIRNDDDPKRKINVAAIDPANGKQLWMGTFEKKKKSHDFLPVPQESALLVIVREKKKAAVQAYGLFDGKFRWERSYKIFSKNGHPPKPLISKDGVLNFMAGVQKLSMTNGKTEWERGNIVLDGRTPPPKRDGNKLLVVDHEGSLHTIDAVTGKASGSVQMDQEVRYTNIYPLGDHIYLRGFIGNKKSPVMYIVDALRKSDSKKLWRYSGKVPSVSNLIDDGKRLYFSTPSTVVCLDRATGKEIFSSPASQAGRSFPVQIKKYGKSVVIIGEVIIAGFDAATGKGLWKHGVTPLTPGTHLDFLDSFNDRLQERNGVLTKGLWTTRGGIADYFTQQARISQNLSNQYYSQSGTYFQSSKSSYNLSAQSDYWKSQNLQNQARIENAYSGAFAQLGFFFAMKELGEKMLMNTVKRDQGELKKLEFIRRSLYGAYLAAQDGDYAYRPHLEGGFTGLYVVHLPTGKSAFTSLSPDSTGYHKSTNWNSRGLWSMLDLKRGLVYHHALMISPEKFQRGDLADDESNYGVFLVAQPVKIPR